jgi:hypothetical protein
MMRWMTGLVLVFLFADQGRLGILGLARHSNVQVGHVK